MVKTRGDAKHIHLITVNVTSLHEVNRKWLADQSADIILVQEHRLLHEKYLGKSLDIPLYSALPAGPCSRSGGGRHQEV